MADTVGYRIRLAAFWNGTNEAQLARDLEMTPQGLNKLVRGETPGNTDLGDGESRLQKIARILEVPVQWLTSGYPKQPWEAAVREAMEAVPKPKRRARIDRVDEPAVGAGAAELDEIATHLTDHIAALEAEINALRHEIRRRDRADAERAAAQRPDPASPGTRTAGQ